VGEGVRLVLVPLPPADVRGAAESAQVGFNAERAKVQPGLHIYDSSSVNF